MNFIDTFFKFNDENHFKSFLEAFKYEFSAIDPIGVITKTNDKDEIVTVPGYHVNIRLVEGEEIPEDFKEFEIPVPTNPVRVWF